MSRQTHEQRLAKWAQRGQPGTEPVPAATVILIRNCEAGLETLMLRRNSKIAFGGMWVFPGGRVDPEDTAGIAPDDDMGHARIAAVRETDEEAGLKLTPSELVPLSHWTPPHTTPRRFLTWFFVAVAPPGEVVIDHGEIHEHAWMSPEEALERRDHKQIELAPPTWVSLHELTRWRTVDETLAGLRGREPERFATHIAVSDDGPIAMWHGDAGWENGDAERAGDRHRLSMHDGVWRYERTR